LLNLEQVPCLQELQLKNLRDQQILAVYYSCLRAFNPVVSPQFVIL